MRAIEPAGVGWRLALVGWHRAHWRRPWPPFSSPARSGRLSHWRGQQPWADADDRTYRILSVNVTAATSSWPLVADLPWDVALLQESRLTADSHVLADIRKRGWHVLPGLPDVDGCNLVMMVFKFGAVSEIPLILDPRLQGALWCPGGRSHFRLYNLYGVADASEYARAHVSGLARLCLVDSESAGCMPFDQRGLQLRAG